MTNNTQLPAADFVDYIRNERNAISKEMLSDEWWLEIPPAKRVVFENVLIAYDQMVDRLSKLGIANEALSGDGEKEDETKEIKFAEWLNDNYISIEAKEGKHVYVEYGPQEYDRKKQYLITDLFKIYQKEDKQ